MKILVGYLNNPLGRAALSLAVEEAKARSAHLILFRHVRVSTEREQTGDTLMEAQAELDALAEQLRRDSVDAVGYTSIGLGSAGGEILTYAQRVSADRIVVGVRRRSPVGKAVLGGDAQEVLLGAEGDVLVAKVATD